MLVTFEGCEGAGKSTIIKMLAKEYKNFVYTREPGGSEVGESIRNIILNNDMDSKTELLLFSAARNEHLVKTLLPNLSQGKTVICDRFTDSTLVYQGYVRKLSGVQIINNFVMGDLEPNITIYLDIDPKIGLERIKEKNRIDNEKIEFHNKVREGYKTLLKTYPNRIIEVNADQPIDEVYKDVINIFQKYNLV
jgi:dTMP kinase